jgi:hypothetical protein
MLSPMVRCGRGRSAGSRSRSRAAARRRRGRTLRLPTRMSPLVMSIMRLTIRIVVLPQPDGRLARRSTRRHGQGEPSTRGLSGIALRRLDELQLDGLGVAGRPSDWACVDAQRGPGRERMIQNASSPTHRPRGGLRGVLQRVVQRRQRAPTPGRARWRPASRRTRRSWAAAGRVYAEHGAVRPPRTPSTPERPSLPWPRRTRPSCARRRPPRARQVLARQHAGWPASSSTSIATSPISRGARVQSRGRRGRRPAAAARLEL